MALKHSAKSLQLLRDGATPHGKEKFKFDNESIRPSHLDKAVKAIYEDIEAVDSKETGGTSLWLEGTGQGALKQNETCTASAESAVAIGNSTKALGRYSSAEGFNTEAGLYTPETTNETVDNILMLEHNGKYKPTYLPYDQNKRDYYLNVVEESISNGLDGFQVVLEDNSGNSANWLVTGAFEDKAEITPGTFEGVLVLDTVNGGPYISNPGFTSLKIIELIPGVDNHSAHSEGIETKATGKASHSEGDNTTASGENSHSEGYRTQALGNRSHVEGAYSIAEGESSHAEGNNNKATGTSSHAEGIATEANGTASHSQGNQTIANGNYSHAAGDESTANGLNSFVHSKASEVNGEYSAVVGGQGMQLDENDTVAVPDLQIRKSHAIPASTADTVGGPGSVTWDDDFMYIKTTAGWKRTALSTF